HTRFSRDWSSDVCSSDLAMGPAAPEPSAEDETENGSPVTFEVAARLPTKTWCGSPTKDHILESAGNGVALLDYDGDGLLDIYLRSEERRVGKERRTRWKH